MWSKAISYSSLITLSFVLLLPFSGFGQDGTLNTSFVPGTGTTNGSVRALGVQSTGDIIAAGAFTSWDGSTINRIVRLGGNDGALDATFNTNIGTGANNAINDLVVLSDDRIVIVGDFTSFDGTTRNRVAILNSDGTLDTGFDLAGTGFDAEILTLAVESDDQILVGGYFTDHNGTTVNGIARLDSDGSLDATFLSVGDGVSGGVTNSVWDIELESDEQIIIAGDFGQYNGNASSGLARLDTDGAFDATFNVGTGISGGIAPVIYDVALTSGELLVIGGEFTSYNGTARSNIAMTDTDGSLYSSFNPGSGTDASVNSIVIASDKRIIIGGTFADYDGNTVERMVKINESGDYDNSFDTSTGADSQVDRMLLISNTELLIGGGFLNYQGSNQANRIAVINNSVESLIFYSQSSGAFDLTSIWNTATDGSGMDAVLTDFTDGGSDFVIQSGHSITESSIAANIGNLTVDGSYDATSSSTALDVNNLSISSGGSFQIGNQDVSINGNAIVSGTLDDGQTTGSITFNGTLTVESTGSFAVTGLNTSFFYFHGNIVNRGTFNLTNSTQWYIESDLTIDNQTATNMNFAQSNSGVGNINANLTLSSTVGGNINLYSNSYIRVANGMTIRNEIGDYSSGTGYLRMTEIRPLTGTITLQNGANARLMYAGGGTYDSGVSFDFTETDNEVIFSSVVGTQELLGTYFYHLTIINGTTTNNLQGNTIIAGNLTIGSLPIIDANNFDLTIGGNLNNNNGTAGFVPGTGTVTLNGSGTTTQNVFGSTDFYNLIIDHTGSSGQVNIAGDFTVSNQLTLTSGNINLSTSSTIGFLASSQPISGTFSSMRMIQLTDATSVVRKYYDAIGSYDFPIGTTGTYTPSTITLSSGTTFESTTGTRYVEVSAIATEAPNVLNNGLSLTKYWTVNSTNLSNLTGTLLFTYDDAEVVGTESSYVAAYYNSSWTTVTGVTPATNTISLALSGLGSLNANYTAGELSAFVPSIPSNLLVDSAYGLNSPQVILAWNDNSTNETDFEIDRAEDAAFSVNLQTFNFGGSNGSASATYTDNTVTSGTLYFYRVRATNVYGNSDYSNIITAVPVVEAGNAASFDAAAEFVNVSPSIQKRTDYTFTCWFKDNGSSIGDIYTEGAPANLFLIAKYSFDSGVRLGVYNAGSWYWVYSAPVPIGEWNFLAISVTGASDTGGDVTILLNNSITTGTTRQLKHASTVPYAVFGKNVGGTNGGGQPAENFTGELDEASIWSRGLSITEMKALRDSGITPGDPDLLSLWHFDEPNSSATVYDASGNGNDGTRTNSPQQVTSEALHPFAPQTFSVVPTDGQAELVWEESFINDFKEYTVSYKLNTDVTYTAFQQSGITNTSTTITSLTNGSLYDFKITTTDVVDQTGPESLEVHEVPESYVGNAASFDGTNSDIVIADNAIFNRGTGLTLEAWIRPDNLNGTNQFIAGVSDAFALTVNNSDQLEFFTYDGVIGESGTDVSGLLIQGNWVHVAMTFQPGTTNLYLNGQLVYTSATSPYPQNSTLAFTMGATSSGTQFFTGLMDEVRLWDNEIDQETLLTNASLPLRGDETNVGTYGANLIGLWHFDEPTGHSTAYSTPSNLHNGTLGGNADFVISGAMTLPEIEVYVGIDNTGTLITDGQSTWIDYQTVLGTDLDITFAIVNSGVADLNISDISVLGTDFSIIGAIPTMVASGTTETFIIRLSGASLGAFSDFVEIYSDDFDESVFDFPLRGNVTTPEINAYVGSDNTGTALTDGQATVIDFGTALVGNNLDQQFTIENTGSSDLNISGIVATGTDFSIVGSVTTIVAGATNTFIIRLSGASTGTFNSTVTITSDDVDESIFDFPITGTISATADPEIEVFTGMDNTGTAIVDGQGTAIDFGSANEGTDITQTFAIENTGTADLSITGINVSGTTFSVSGTPSLVTAGSTENFTVTLSGGSTGTFNSTVTITSDDVDESIFDFPITGTISVAGVPEIDLYLGTDNTGTVITDAQVTPLDFGSATVGTNITLTFAIDNPGLTDLSISSISLTGTDFSILNPPITVNATSTETFDIVLSGVNSGTFNDVVTIVSDDLDENPFTFPITGTITAATANQEITILFNGLPLISGVSSIDFGSTELEINVTQSVTIGNIGIDDLIITDIQLLEGSIFTFPNLSFPITLAPTETQDLDIAMDASVVGSFEDQITILSNDLDESSFQVTLLGEVIDTSTVNILDGNTNEVIITGQDINLGQTLVNVQVDKNFGIENLSSSEVLQILSITVDNPVFEIVNAPSTVAPLGREEFTVRLLSNTGGTYSAAVTVTTNINDFSFGVTGVVIDEGDPPLTVYNIVTPNGDGIHDFFKIVNIEAYPSSVVSIFDRWGGRVFEVSNYNNTTNFFVGISDNGDALITGNYYFVIDKGNGDKPERGFILLKR